MLLWADHMLERQTKLFRKAAVGDEDEADHFVGSGLLRLTGDIRQHR